MLCALTRDEPLAVHGSGEEPDYARHLLKDLGARVFTGRGEPSESPARRWRHSGMRDLTGFPDAPGADCPVALASYADGVLDAYSALAARPLSTTLRGGDLLAQRAAFDGLVRRGAIAPGGACRLLPTTDGHIAISLPRSADWQLLDAWLCAPTEHGWAAVARAVHRHSSGTLVRRGRLLGLAVADTAAATSRTAPWYTLEHCSAATTRRQRPPRVVDLSSLWAGPLCSRLLQWAGADVLKLESSLRPDGSAAGSPAFYAFLNGAKQRRSLDLHTTAGQRALETLLRGADIVIEASRPRALRQMDIAAESILDEVPGITWISITGHGRGDPEGDWIAFGDDAGVAAGLSQRLHEATGRWMFCGDAVADPLTGMHAALAALASYRAGGGHLLGLSLAGTVRHCINFADRHGRT